VVTTPTPTPTNGNGHEGDNFNEFKAGTATSLSIGDFLQTVVTADEGKFCLAIYSPSTGWKEEWYTWPNQLEAIVIRAVEASLNGFNVYFSSYLFKAPSSTKDNVLPSRTIQADLDNASIDILPLDPSFIIETSPSRYQAYWILDKDQQQDLETHERFSHKITYNIDRCDHSGWPLGRKVRLPGTNNYKYSDIGNVVELRSIGKKDYTAADFELLPELQPYVIFDASRPPEDIKFMENPPVLDVGPQELFHSIKGKLDLGTISYFNTKSSDRSKALWALTMNLFRIGLPKEQVYWIVRDSENNKFRDQRYHSDRDLAKDVFRAEEDYRLNRLHPRDIIAEIRKRKVSAKEKKDAIQEVILETFRAVGSFFKCSGELDLWYIRHANEEPVAITPHSERLATLLDRQFGVNATDSEAQYVAHGLYAFCTEDLPVNGSRETLSYYNPNDNSLLLHSGTRDIYRIATDKVEKIHNGANGVVFPWSLNMEPFSLDVSALDSSVNNTLDWSTLMFGESVKNVTDMSPEEAQTLLSVWLLFILFKSISPSRPILALFGQPGAGKSTIFRCVYALLYGPHEPLSGVTSSDNYDFSTSHYPLLVLDNVDTWERWLPDRLAQSASTSNIAKRKLYTDIDVKTFKRKAMIGISAHSPKFGREDVADRLLIIMLERLEHFRPEGELVNNILKNRNAIWGAIARDVQYVLRTPKPSYRDAPQFRIEDFAYHGYWIAQAIGKGEVFRRAINAVSSEQKQFVLEEDAILVSAIDKYVRRNSTPEQYKLPGTLWIDLQGYADDPNAFERLHRNAVMLSKKLWTLQHSLKERYDITFVDDKDKGRMWRIQPLNTNTGPQHEQVGTNGRAT